MKGSIKELIEILVNVYVFGSIENTDDKAGREFEAVVVSRVRRC